MGLQPEGQQQGVRSILVVDDDRMARTLYSRFLKRSGFEVVSVDSGAAALAQIGQRAFDLALIDIVMPEISGIELLQQLPPREASGPRVIMMSGTQCDSVSARCAALGADTVLVKPIPAALLEEHVQRAIAH